MAELGRRRGLKILRVQTLVGSSPTRATFYFKQINIAAAEARVLKEVSCWNDYDHGLKKEKINVFMCSACVPFCLIPRLGNWVDLKLYVGSCQRHWASGYQRKQLVPAEKEIRQRF